MSDITGENLWGEFTNLVSKIKGRKYPSLKDVVALKMDISCVNNIITKALEFSFIEWLWDKGIISENQYKSARETWRMTGSNTNGYDVYIEGKDEEKSIVAEIKANVPVEKGQYGAAQISAIKEDVRHLLCGKSTSQVGGDNLENCIKFQVMLDTNINGAKTEAAIERLVGQTQEERRKGFEACKIINDALPEKWDTEKVYIKQLGLPESIS